MVHDGMFFHATNRIVGLANGASHDVLTAIPAAVFPHIRADLYTFEDTPVDIKTYEGTTTSADGTVIPVFNRNRNSANTPGLVLTHSPTVTDVGTLIHDRLVPSAGAGVGQKHGSISAGFGEEWVFKPSTKYLVRLTNNAGAAIDITYELFWYEINYTELGGQ
jgi:hypothetical protein